MKPKVLIRTRAEKNIENIVRESLRKFRIPKHSNYIIKPNLGFKTNTKGGTTHLGLIESVLRILYHDYKPKNIYLVESDGIAFSCEEVFKFLGLDKICSKYNTDFINLSKQKTKKITNKRCRLFKKFDMPEIFTKENILINLPKIKTHEIAGFCCCIKNLFGLYPNIFRFEYHSVISDVLYDMSLLFKPNLNIVDAIWAINKHGPWSGVPVKLDTIVSGNNPLTTDLECLKIINWSIDSVPYLRMIQEREGHINYQVSGEIIFNKKFKWQTISTIGHMKEVIASKIFVPMIKRGFPLLYYSQGSLKLVTYGKKGKYCKSIHRW